MSRVLIQTANIYCGLGFVVSIDSEHPDFRTVVEFVERLGIEAITYDDPNGSMFRSVSGAHSCGIDIAAINWNVQDGKRYHDDDRLMKGVVS